MPTTTHLIFDAQQRPFEVVPSPDDKTLYSCNYISSTRGVSTAYLEQVAQKLEDAGIGTRNTDIFIGRQRTRPNSTGPHIELLSTSGIEPTITYSNSVVLDKPGLQVLVSGDDSSVVESKALEIYSNLIASVNVDLSDS